MIKRCRRCDKRKDLSEFYTVPRNPKLHRPYCKECHNKASKKNYEADKRAWRATFYERRYGISIDEFEAMLEQQDGVCAVCHQPETSNKFNHLSVDHDHQTGAVRGLLCARCNRLLGVYEKNPEIFRGFDHYLNRSINAG